MLTRISSWRELPLPIAFALICMVLAVAVWRAFGGGVPFEPQGYRFTTTVPEANSVLVNSDVRIAGVDVGRVVDVRSDGRAARVTVELQAAFAPLRSGARAIVRTKTLLGEGYLEIAPGAASTARIPDGGRLPAANVRRAQRLDDVLKAFAPRTRRDLRAMIGGVATAFDERGGDLNDALGRTAPLVTDLAAVTRTLQSQQDDLRQLLASSTDVLDAIGGRSDGVRAAIEQGDRVFAATADRDRALRATIDALPPFLGDLRAAAGNLDAASGDLRRAVGSLRPTAPLVAPALAALRDDTTKLRRAFSHVAPVLRTASASLPSAERILDAAGPSLSAVHLAARQLLPLARLSADSRGAFVANFANVASLFNGRWVLPGGRLGQYAGGMLTAWNEIVGGWTKKLPTNRSNPYPRPGQTDNMNRGGLEAYDCRNLDNPLILPAFGAAPPCKTQGPWTFDGKRAYYPRLTLPAP